MSMKSIGAFIAILIGTGAAALSDPLLTETYDAYDIQGDSSEALLRSIKATRGDLQHHALTSWQVQWQLSWRSTADSCRLIEHEVTVDVVYRLPRWRGMVESSDPQLVRRWQAYDQALRTHERGHCAIAFEAAQAIENILAKMGSRESCDRLVEDANGLAAGVLERHQQKELTYDRETDHGATQGAVFP